MYTCVQIIPQIIWMCAVKTEMRFLSSWSSVSKKNPCVPVRKTCWSSKTLTTLTRTRKTLASLRLVPSDWLCVSMSWVWGLGTKKWCFVLQQRTSMVSMCNLPFRCQCCVWNTGTLDWFIVYCVFFAIIVVFLWRIPFVWHNGQRRSLLHLIHVQSMSNPCPHTMQLT